MLIRLSVGLVVLIILSPGVGLHGIIQKLKRRTVVLGVFWSHHQFCFEKKLIYPGSRCPNGVPGAWWLAPGTTFTDPLLAFLTDSTRCTEHCLKWPMSILLLICPLHYVLHLDFSLKPYMLRVTECWPAPSVRWPGNATALSYETCIGLSCCHLSSDWH